MSEHRKILECIVGSHAYGTNIETSDVDVKGVYIQNNLEILGTKYKEQIVVDKDTTYYEVRRFLELAATANPTILEMLFMDEKFIKFKDPIFDIIYKERKQFLTKHCANSFGGYAVQQIKKAKGLNKKMNWEESDITRKTPLDFCFVHKEGKSISLIEFLKQEGMIQEFVGLSALNRMPGCYSIFYDWGGHYGKDLNKSIPPIGYRGIAFENSNDIRLSSIPKEQICYGILYYNKDAYSMHCNKYNEYQTWLRNRNTQRYVDVENHNQRIDGKNMMHCIRLLNCAREIAETGNFTVFREERQHLLDIRSGKINLEQLINEAEEKIKDLDLLYSQSNLPNSVDPEFIHQLLIAVRNDFSKRD